MTDETESPDAWVLPLLGCACAVLMTAGLAVLRWWA